MGFPERSGSTGQGLPTLTTLVYVLSEHDGGGTVRLGSRQTASILKSVEETNRTRPAIAEKERGKRSRLWKLKLA